MAILSLMYHLTVYCSLLNIYEWILYEEILTKSGKEKALWHFGHIILVEEFAFITFLTETTQPMFTDNLLFSSDMPEWTHVALCTGIVLEKRANCCIWFCNTSSYQFNYLKQSYSLTVTLETKLLFYCNSASFCSQREALLTICNLT